MQSRSKAQMGLNLHQRLMNLAKFLRHLDLEAIESHEPSSDATRSELWKARKARSQELGGNKQGTQSLDEV